MKTAVVILNDNGKQYLERFLHSVVANSNGADIYVADNGSTDDSAEFLKASFPGVKLINISKNSAFAEGYNQALAKVKADYYVLLSSEVEVCKHWLDPCVKMLDDNVDIAAVQPKILAFDNKAKFGLTGGAGGFLDKHFFPFCQGRIFDEVETDSGQYDTNREVFWASGTCLFIRAELYHQFDGLDNDFFNYMAEIDLCWRLKKSGHQIYYCADSKVFCANEETLAYKNPRKTYLNFRNSLYMISKNYDGTLLPKLFNRLVLDGIAAIRFLLRLELGNFKAVFMSHMHFYRHWPKLKVKRQEIKAMSGKFNSSGLYKRSIPVMKFIKGIKSFRRLSEKDFHQ